MQKISFFRWAVFSTYLFSASTVLAQDFPDPRQVTIKSISYQGLGCDQGSVAADLSEDAKAFTLLFDSFTVESSVDEPRAQKSCALDLVLKVPAGWAYSLFSLD